MLEGLMLFLVANNFLLMANSIGILMLGLYLWKSRLKIGVPKSKAIYVLILASLSFLVLYIKNYGMPETSTMVLRYFLPIIFFYLGEMNTKGLENKLKTYTLCIAFGSFVHGFSNIIINRNLDILSIAGRQYNDVYGGVITGTLQNLFFVFSCSLLAYGLLCENKKWLKVMECLSAIIGVYGSIVNASRTMIYVTILVFMIISFVHIWKKKSFSFAVFKWTGIGLFILIIVIIVLWLDLFHVQELFATTALGRRQSVNVAGHTVFDNLRWQYSSEILQQLPSHLLGGIEHNSYAHNLWVDVAREAGIIPFCLYILFSLIICSNLWEFMNNSRLSHEIRILMLSIQLSCMLSFFTEPIMQGAPLIFSLYCYTCGSMISFNKRSIRKV